MTRDEIDVMWQKALHDSVRDGEQFTRYHFAEMVAAAQRESNANTVEQMGIEGYGTLAIAVAIRAGGQQ